MSSLYTGVSASEVEEHLSVGMTLLAKGQYSDALSHFHAAIDADPANYMSYYKRATVFLGTIHDKAMKILMFCLECQVMIMTIIMMMMMMTVMSRQLTAPSA